MGVDTAPRYVIEYRGDGRSRTSPHSKRLDQAVLARHGGMESESSAHGSNASLLGLLVGLAPADYLYYDGDEDGYRAALVTYGYDTGFIGFDDRQKDERVTDQYLDRGVLHRGQRRRQLPRGRRRDE